MILVLVAPLLQRIVNPGVPPVIISVAEPSLAPKQDIFCFEMVLLRAFGCKTFMEVKALQPEASVIV